MVTLPHLSVDTFGLTPPKFKRGFFIDHRKGEVGELRLLLRKMALDNQCVPACDQIISSITKTNIQVFNNSNIAKRRDILKRLIRCMTLGIDLSRLYNDVIMVSQTDDTVQKRMVYLYLSTYSASNPDLAILAINTLLKDVENIDPVIRCLAIRNITSLGIPLSVEYATSVISKRLYDPCESVKRTAIICSIRNHKNKAILSSHHCYKFDIHNSSIIQDIKSTLRSSNVHIMFDAMCTISEIMDVDNISLTTSSMIYLANCLHSMNEWEQCICLEILSTFVPQSNDELYDLMNLLDSMLNHISSSVVLATAKCFITWTKHDLSLQLEVIRRLQNPFISLIISSRNEISYIVLVNTLSIIVNVSKIISDSSDEVISKYPIPFKDHYDIFFCNYDDPSYVKHVKLDILVSISCNDNCLDIIRELNEYVSDTNHDIATKSIRALGIIALKSPNHLDMIIKLLSLIFELRVSYLISSILYIIKGLLIIYPHYSVKLLDIIKDKNEYIKDNESKEYYIWILGEFGYDLDHTPYTLENYIDNENNADSVMEELLSSSMKVFLKRPPEMITQLTKIFKRVINESTNPTLINLASFYYNLLKTNVNMAKNVFSKHDNEFLDNKFMFVGHCDIFNPDPLWIEHLNTVHLIENCKGRFKRFFPYTHGDSTNDIFKPEEQEHDDVKESDIRLPDESYISSLLPSYNDNFKIVELLRNELGSLDLMHPNTVLSEKYQKEWFELDKVYTSTTNVASLLLENINIEQLENILSNIHIITLASGKARDTTKLYLYTENKNRSIYYIEVIIGQCDVDEDKGYIKVSIKINKSEDDNIQDDSIDGFSKIICDLIRKLIEK